MIFQKLFNRVFHPDRLSVKHVLALFSFVFVFWALYRYFPELLPAWVEELILNKHSSLPWMWWKMGIFLDWDRT